MTPIERWEWHDKTLAMLERRWRRQDIMAHCFFAALYVVAYGLLGLAAWFMVQP